MFRPLLRIVLVLALAAATVLAVSWPLPFAAVHAGGTRWDLLGWAVAPKAVAPDLWWADTDNDGSRGWGVPHAGRYLHAHHPLVESVDFRRIIFTGTLEEKPYYRRNPPPAWAVTLSTDMREGYEQVVTTATGWPWRAFRCEHWISWRVAPAPPTPPLPITIGGTTIQVPTVAEGPPTERWKGGLAFTHHGTLAGVVPLLPIWPALLADWAVFVAGWSAIVLAVSGVRRLHRRRRSLCTCCGYPLAGLAQGTPCPECGHKPEAARA